MAGIEEATAEAEGPVSKELAAEIDEAVKLEIPEKGEETPEEKAPAEGTPKEGEEVTPKEGEEEPADQGDDDSEKSDQEPQGEESPDEPEGEDDPSEAVERDDELLTRAVLAGMGLKDARTFAAQDADALERNIGLLEKASQQAGEGDEGAGADESAAADEDPLSGIPDLDPEVYDENLVSGFKAMKSVIKKQEETIKRLSSGGEKSWFNSQVESLKVKDLTDAKRTELNEQFDVLKAGYAAQGQKRFDDAAVFQQATKLVLGDEIKATADAVKTKKLEKRANLQTARPGSPAAKAQGDPFEEVAKEIDKEVFSRK